MTHASFHFSPSWLRAAGLGLLLAACGCQEADPPDAGGDGGATAGSDTAGDPTGDSGDGGGTGGGADGGGTDSGDGGTDTGGQKLGPCDAIGTAVEMPVTDDCADGWLGQPVVSDSFKDITWDQAAGQAWAVTGNGGVVRIDGDDWTVLQTPGDDYFVNGSLSVAPDGSLWVMGFWEVLRWTEAGGWRSIPVPDYNVDNYQSLVVRASGDVVVGSKDMGSEYPGYPSDTWVATYDCSSWTEVVYDQDSQADAIVELDDGRLVLAGGGIWVEDGAGFTRVHGDSTHQYGELATDGEQLLVVEDGQLLMGPLTALAAVSEAASGTFGTVALHDGVGFAIEASTATLWSSQDGWQTVGTLEGDVVAAAASAVDELLVVSGYESQRGERWRPAGVEAVYSQDSVTHARYGWVDEAGDTWALGYYGTFVRWSAAGLEVMATVDLLDYALSIGGSSASDIVAANGGSQLLAWDGSEAVLFEVPGAPADVAWIEVSVGSDGAVWVSGTDYTTAYLARRIDGEWSLLDAALPDDPPYFDALWAFDADSVVALAAKSGRGSSLIEWDGSTWTWLADTDETVLGTFLADSPDDLLISGYGTYHWDGSTLTEVPGAMYYIRDLAQTDRGLLAAGKDSSGAHLVQVYDGTSWTTELEHTDNVFLQSGLGEPTVTADGWFWQRCE